MNIGMSSVMTDLIIETGKVPQYFNIYTRKDGTTVVGVMKESVESSVGLGDMTIDFGNVGTFETFRYLNGDITKVEQEGGE